MKHRPDVKSLNKEFGNHFFLTEILKSKYVCMEPNPKSDVIAEILRRRGLVCIPIQEYYYISKKGETT